MQKTHKKNHNGAYIIAVSTQGRRKVWKSGGASSNGWG